MDENTRGTAIAELQTLLLDTAGCRRVRRGRGPRGRPPRRCGHLRHHHIAPRRPAHARRGERRGGRALRRGGVRGRRRPCLTSIDVGRIVHVPDIAQETRWPSWRAAAQANGFASAAALPRVVRPGVHIALNLYAADAHAWDDAAIAVADMYADEIARTVALCLRSTDQVELNADLRAALVSRAVIDQAIGVVMAENRCTAEEALAILRSASRHRKVKLREVASVIVEAVTGSPPHERDTFRERV